MTVGICTGIYELCCRVELLIGIGTWDRTLLEHAALQ